MDRERAPRRDDWVLMSLDEPFPAEGCDTSAECLGRMEALRRASFAMQGLDYPTGPTPKHQRARWPIVIRR